MENISWGRKGATDQEVINAAGAAQCAVAALTGENIDIEKNL